MAEQAIIDGLKVKVLSAVSEALNHAISEAIREAYRAGEDAARSRVLEAIGAQTKPSEPRPAVFISSSKSDDAFRRAPKGLTKEVVTTLLSQKPDGLFLEEVQELAVGHDSRLSQKTVYNELMRGRRAEYRHVMGKWYLAAMVPNVKAPEPFIADEEVTQVLG
jgi:hypothetical protein